MIWLANPSLKPSDSSMNPRETHSGNPIAIITPVLCFLEAEWPLFGAPGEFHGVRLESHRSIKLLLTRDAALDEASAEAITRSLAMALRPK